VIGIGGFALAYIIIYVFVLPSKIVPPPQKPYVPDTVPTAMQPIDTAALPTPVEPPPMTAAAAPPPTASIPLDVPDLTGMALPDARSVLNGMHLRATVDRDTSSFQPPGTVLRQSPAAGAKVPVNGTIRLTASYFPPERASDTMPVRPPAESTPAPSERPIQRGRTLPPIIPADSDTTRRRHPPDSTRIP
jgi:hypothetical protein